MARVGLIAGVAAAAFCGGMSVALAQGCTVAHAERQTAPATGTADHTASIRPDRRGPATARPVTRLSPAAPHRAKASATGAAEDLLAPIRQIVGERAALLIRRSVFNEAPTAAPVQLTGQVHGPVTGSLEAADPEGDGLRYAITGNPRHGTAVVNRDGTYTYTPGGDFTGSDSFVVAVTDTGFHLNLLDLFRPASTSAGVAVSQGALTPALRFQFVYGSGSQYWSGAARSALESAADRLSSAVIVEAPVTLTYTVTGTSSPFSPTLATAGSDLVSGNPGFQQTVAQNKILSGVDANGSAADGSIDWNFGRAWALGTVASNSQYDFGSTATHELMHTLGFLSSADAPGTNTGRVWTVYDSYLVDSTGHGAVNADGTFNAALNPNLTGGRGGMYFGGPHAVAAHGGPVPLYTPRSWESGSSLSHLDDSTFTGSTRKMMNAFVSTGPGVRSLSPVELGVLADIGYTVNPDPQPLLLSGLIGLGFRRRRRAAQPILGC